MRHFSVILMLIIVASGSRLLAQQQIKINADVKYQVVEGFGGSDAWNCDYVGKYWSSAQKEAIAKLLFSKNFKADGNPEGIGLSRWRFNIGAGSEEQKPAGDFDNPERRVECFLNADSTYNWEKQGGQQWFLQKANEYGVESLVAFMNSPPVYYTKNGLAHGSGSATSNLAEDRYDDYAEFLATVLKHFRDEGIDFEWISPVNEPQWLWDGGQEGCTWTNQEIYNVIDNLNTSLLNNDLDTKIMTPEAGDWQYLYTQKSPTNKSNQIETFFNPSSASYLGNFSRVPAVICGHTYWTFFNNSELVDVRNSVYNKVRLFDLDLYQTEYSELSDVDETLSSYMDYALFMAKVIYTDLRLAHSKAWSFWTVLERERWSQMNRFYLIRLIPSGGDYGELTTGGTHFAGKTLWVFGNYSRFIRPGYQQIQLAGASDLSSLLGSAFIAADSSEIVTVFVNLQNTAQQVKTSFLNLPSGKGIDSISVYVTDGIFNNLASKGQISAADNYTLPARSVVTMVARMIESADTSSRVGSWTLRYVDSEETVGENGLATNAFDGNVNTFWHTQWNGGATPYPHEIQIDLGQKKLLSGFRYLPRQYGGLNGTIADYEFYITSDSSNWGEAVASGTWAANKNEKTVLFTPDSCRYIRLVAKSEINGNAWASAAEISLIEGIVSSLPETETGLARDFVLFQNFPNPFNPATVISYQLPMNSVVILKIYDTAGREIKTLVNEEQQAGEHKVVFDASQLASGVYLYTLETGGVLRQARKLVLIK